MRFGYKGVINLSGFGTEVMELVAPATSALIISRDWFLSCGLLSESLSTQSSSFSLNA